MMNLRVFLSNKLDNNTLTYYSNQEFSNSILKDSGVLEGEFRR